MRSILILLASFCAIAANAQNYLIGFAGTGASVTVSSVKVENLNKGTSVTLNGSDILGLTPATGIEPLQENTSSELIIYPNPVTDNSTLQIYPPVAGNAIISIFDMTGKSLAGIQSRLENTRQDFNLSGIKKGMYLINVQGTDFHFSGKLLSNGESNSTIRIEKVNTVIQAVDEKSQKAESKGTQATINMAYTTGDRLKFTGSSGIYSTVKTDIPVSDKTITFNFLASTDGDNNNYPIVEIGTQVWMAENLKTTKYNDNSAIPLVTGNTAWAALSSPGYCLYNNDAATFKATYGALYNWYAVDAASNGSKNICPAGWHVPTDAEWITLATFLGGESDAGGKIKETGLIHWQSPNTAATNESGYSALPGGSRDAGGSFYDVNNTGRWWSSTGNSTSDAWYQSIHHNGSSMDRNPLNNINGISVRCLRGNMLLLPVVTTSSAGSITVNSAISGGNVISDGGATVTERGICWSTSPNPNLSDSHSSNGNGLGSFTSNLSGLSPGYQYYVRAFATSSSGTAYGNQVTFNTKIADVDGNTYNTVTIGTQVWMAENLKTTKYKDGVSIPYITDDYEWYMHSSPAYCWFNNDEATYKNVYGGLYNWYAVNTGKLCPTGWHPPSNAEWETLATYLGGKTIAGGKLKEAGTSHWLSPNTGATNESGFTALPGGSRSWGGSFLSTGSGGVWWSSSYGGGDGDQTYKWSMNSGSAELSKNDDYNEKNGSSVRCIRGELQAAPVLTTTPVTSITTTTAVSGGNITSAGDADITTRGLCWNTSGAPTIADSYRSYGFGLGSFSFTLTSLTPGVKYYVRAYATNSVGTSYGESLSFNTKIADVDGNTYNTVTIGDQIWMAENLKTTKYNDGNSIPNVTDQNSWMMQHTEAYCWYNNDAATYKNTYGGLYKWYAVNTGKLCPAGWHVPANTDWQTLVIYAGGASIAGGRLKETGTTHWLSPNTSATDAYGFTALPGGLRDFGGAYSSVGSSGLWWSSTYGGGDGAQTFGWTMNRSSAAVSNLDYEANYGFSIRCLKN